MPINTMNFKDGVFYAEPVGYFDNVDGRMWANALKNYATKHPAPIVAIVDIHHVDRMCSTLAKILSTISQHENVLAIAITTGETMSSRHDRILQKLTDISNLRVFTRLSDAEHYVMSQMNPMFGAYTSQSVMVYQFASV